ncbi:MAG: DUF3795 domain-containing protein [Candidatus Lokiarchaeota archaeon]|nr:DUF3795 domain-containing protein [Candidatus Lokiarchaeota archaeon]
MKKTYYVAGFCGTICDDCDFFTGNEEPQCPGCVACAGRPFWGECRTANCALNKKVEHCGLCSDFPCEILPNQFDPNKPRGKEEAIFRIGQLAIRAKIGTNCWLKKRVDGSIVGFEADEREKP